MPVTREAKLPGVPAVEMEEGQLARIVGYDIGHGCDVPLGHSSPFETECMGMVVMRFKDQLVEVGGSTVWCHVATRIGDLPRVEILPNGSTLTVTENE